MRLRYELPYDQFINSGVKNVKKKNIYHELGNGLIILAMFVSNGHRKSVLMFDQSRYDQDIIEK